MRTWHRPRLRNLARIALLAVAAAGLSACVYDGPYGYGPGYYSPGYYDWYGYPSYPSYPYYTPDYGYFGFGFSGGPYWGPDRDRRDYRTPDRRTAPRPRDGIRPPRTESRPPAGTYRAPPTDNRRRDYNNNS